MHDINVIISITTHRGQFVTGFRVPPGFNRKHSQAKLKVMQNFQERMNRKGLLPETAVGTLFKALVVHTYTSTPTQCRAL